MDATEAAAVPSAHGSFLELSVPTADIQASIAFYAKLGFSAAEVGETRRHPYAVATDGRLCVGLHQAADLEPTVTFVKRGLLRHLPLYERLGVEFDLRRLGGDEFNELGWRDPGGNRLRFVEARTFSPPPRPGSESSLCGYFREIGLPAADLGASKAHWEGIGFVGMDESGALGPYASCTSDTVDVGLYDPQRLRRATLIFDTADLGAAAAAIAAAGIEAAATSAGDGAPGLRLTAPEGTPLLITQIA